MNAKRVDTHHFEYFSEVISFMRSIDRADTNVVASMSYDQAVGGYWVKTTPKPKPVTPKRDVFAQLQEAKKRLAEAEALLFGAKLEREIAQAENRVLVRTLEAIAEQADGVLLSER